ncbi:MAG: transposase [Methanobrevibacter sp.]|jgi:putative transposase|nr:transposase [Candidatus Methanovirga australis]
MVGKGNGWVRFKSKKNPVQSYRTSSNKDSIKIINNKLKINKLKTLIKIKYLRFDGKILSKNLLKTKIKLNKTYKSKKDKIINILHWYTNKIVTEFDNIFVGDVNSKLGLSNKILAKTTAINIDMNSKRQLEYKSEWYGKEFKIVNESYTSKTCSKCNYQNDEMDLNVRSWICPNCGSNHDRILMQLLIS